MLCGGTVFVVPLGEWIELSRNRDSDEILIYCR
jgi:hypothetical protein